MSKPSVPVFLLANILTKKFDNIGLFLSRGFLSLARFQSRWPVSLSKIRPPRSVNKISTSLYKSATWLPARDWVATFMFVDTIPDRFEIACFRLSDSGGDHTREKQRKSNEQRPKKIERGLLALRSRVLFFFTI